MAFAAMDGQMTIIGVIFLLSAAGIPLLGLERGRAYADRWLARGPGLLRGWVVAAAMLGVFGIWLGI